MGCDNPIAVKRNAKGLTRRQLASLVGVTVRTVRNWETWARAPSPDALDKLRQLLELTELEVWRASSKPNKKETRATCSGRRKLPW